MKNLTAEQLIALATSTAIKLAKNFDSDEITILADFFNLIGDVLALISDKDSLVAENSPENSDKNPNPTGS